MKIKCLLLAIMVSMASSGVEAQRRPSVFPGAVPESPGNEMHYLVNASYEDVKSYYINENGEPRRVDNAGEAGRWAFFQYYARMPDPDGVYINYRTGRNRVINRIFSELRGLMTIGHLSQERMDQLSAKYLPYNDHFFKTVENAEGELEKMDEIIFDRYNKKLGGAQDDADAKAMVAKAQELIMSGRIQEGTDLMKKAQEKMMKGLETAVGEEAVDIWIECLEEIVANAYTIMLTIHYFPD